MLNILLNKKKSFNNTNVDNSVPIELSTTTSLLPPNSISTTLNTYEIYLDERNNTKKYKMIFTLYPYMTNVLYNRFTEIIVNEGSEDCFKLTDKPLTKSGPWMYNAMRTIGKTNEFEENSVDNGLTRYEAIRDTEYSHPEIGNFTYQCGVDIFNNHYLRSDGYFAIKKGSDDINKKVINTIADNIIYHDGSISIYNKPNVSKLEENGRYSATDEEVKTHLFNHTNLLTFKDAYIQNLKEEFGWFGFINKGYSNEFNHETKDGKKILVNRCINNKNTCDFIDLYPNRSLFSFLPTININYKNRVEHNWDWCISYPFKRVYKRNIDGDFHFFKEGYGLICKVMTESPSQETQYVYMRTYCNHGLKANDLIRITYTSGSKKMSFSTRIYSVGDGNNDMTQYYFTVAYEDLSEEWGEKKENGEFKLNIMSGDIYISKIVNNVPCDYYIREFKKINGLKSSLNKAGFAKTIYNDDVAQIIYSDDINVSGLRNHLGLEVDEVFLTLIKRNKGYKEWYQDYTKPIPALIEASHCFGEVTSGFNLEASETELQEMVNDKWFDCPNIRLNKEKHIERDIELHDMPQTFYGDFVEFSPSTMRENILEDVYYRFNTSQRETVGAFPNLYWDNLVHDDNDFPEDEETFETFKVKKEELNGVNNINHEGYIYKAHYRVKLKEYYDTISSVYDTNLKAQTLTNNNKIELTNIFLEYHFRSNIPYNLQENDILIIYYGENDYIEGVVVNKTKGVDVYFKTDKPISNERLNPEKIFFKNPNTPDYSYYITDGRGKHVWRNPILESDLPQTSDIYGRAFANGSIYVNTKIDFFLRRQDPHRYYIKNWGGEYINNDDIFVMDSLSQKLPDADYKVKTNYSICEF